MKLRSVADLCPVPETLGLQVDLEGWNSDHSLFRELVTKFQPKVIIECGSWKGRSALHMAELTKDIGTKIYCCDTWLGEANLKSADLENPDKEPCQYNPGAVYRQFLYNVAVSGHANRIFPIVQTSLACARILYYFQIRGEMVYIDADHTYEGAFSDLEMYANLVAPGGVLFGDDWNDFPGVRMAVSRFSFEHHLSVAVNGPAWVLQPRKKEETQ